MIAGARAAALALAVLLLAGCGAQPGGAGDTGAAQAPQAAVASNVPAFDAASGTLTLPDVSVDGTLFGPAVLRRTESGSFAIVQMPVPAGAARMSASRYADGVLRIATVLSGGRRYTNIVLALGGDGTFELRSLNAPLPVLPTSDENKNAIAFDATQVPTVRALGIAPVFPDEQDSNERSVAFGDFFQEGAYAAFVMSNRGANLYGVPFINDTPGVAYFLALGADGRWTDRTAELLPNPADRAVCVSSSYSSVADLNNDGKPDIFVSCTGVDYDLRITDPAQQEQVYLSPQVLFLSQLDGTYRRMELPGRIYGHKAALADLDGDGNVDILTTNQALGGVRMPYVLLGHGDGTFTRNDTIVPANIFDLTGQNDGLYQVWLMPIDGRIDAVFAGGRTVWLKGKAGGGFDTASAVTFQTATSTAFGQAYEMPLDAVYDAARRRFHFHVTAGHAAGTEWAVLGYDTSGALKSIGELWNNTTANFQPYSAQMKPAADGSFVAYTGGCGPTLTGGCAMKVPR